jgi:hypothetical protein
VGRYLGHPDTFVERYAAALQRPSSNAQLIFVACTFGFVEVVTFGVWALAFWYGANVMADRHNTVCHSVVLSFGDGVITLF